MTMLTGEKVKLRPIEEDDVKEVFRWQNDPESSGDYENPRPVSWLEFQEWKKQQAEDRASGKDKSGSFIIETRGDRKISVGMISYRYPARFAESSIEIGYEIAKPAERKKGYASEAVKLMVDYLYLTKNVNRIQAHAITENMGSVKALEKNGFQREGVIREFHFSRGKFRDYYSFSILRKEWKS
jgi:[ribosomal protein S5]-alanine N-acetyltransferase